MADWIGMNFWYLKASRKFTSSTKDWKKKGIYQLTKEERQKTILLSKEKRLRKKKVRYKSLLSNMENEKQANELLLQDIEELQKNFKEALGWDQFLVLTFSEVVRLRIFHQKKYFAVVFDLDCSSLINYFENFMSKNFFGEKNERVCRENSNC